MSQSCPIARHCIPQKQTHQIAITALRSAAPASGGLGPERVGRLPSFAMALSSASTSSTKASTSANASHGPGDVFAGRTAVPILYGLDAIDDGLRDGLSSFRAPLSIQPQVAVTATTVGMSSLQTDTEHDGIFPSPLCNCPVEKRMDEDLERAAAGDHRLVTVFGGTGFLGRRVVRHLLDHRFQVRAASRHPNPIGPGVGPGAR